MGFFVVGIMETKTRGRPKGSVGAYKEITRSEKIMFRITPEQKKELLEKAEENNMTVSNYIVSVLFNNV